jgi:flavin reductase (DIM6/NTAB) family NADH-FMN oxidoreductase RutF
VFYEVGDGSGHKKAGFKHSPFNSLVVPRPIGWISSVAKDGTPNLSPYSFFNAISTHPPAVMYSANGPHMEGGDKDSLYNVRETGEFVVNFCTEALAQQMNDSSTQAPRNIDEFEVAGLTKAPSKVVKAPRVAESPVHLECRVLQILQVPLGEGVNSNIVLGKVVGIHIRDDLVVDGRVDIVKSRPLARLGYFDYCVVGESLEILRPSWPLGGKSQG